MISSTLLILESNSVAERKIPKVRLLKSIFSLEGTHIWNVRTDFNLQLVDKRKKLVEKKERVVWIFK